MSGRIDDLYNKLRNDIGTNFARNEQGGKVAELYSFRCGNCGYHNIHNFKELDCGCGKKVQGLLVYRKIGDTVVYDSRDRMRKRN